MKQAFERHVNVIIRPVASTKRNTITELMQCIASEDNGDDLVVVYVGVGEELFNISKTACQAVLLKLKEIREHADKIVSGYSGGPEIIALLDQIEKELS